MYKYQMDPTKSVGATEQTWDVRQMDVYSEIDCIIVNEASCDAIQYPTDGQMDGRTDGRSETNIPHNNFVVRGIITAMSCHYDMET